MTAIVTSICYSYMMFLRFIWWGVILQVKFHRLNSFCNSNYLNAGMIQMLFFSIHRYRLFFHLIQSHFYCSDILWFHHFGLDHFLNFSILLLPNYEMEFTIQVLLVMPLNLYFFYSFINANLSYSVASKIHLVGLHLEGYFQLNLFF